MFGERAGHHRHLDVAGNIQLTLNALLVSLHLRHTLGRTVALEDKECSTCRRQQYKGQYHIQLPALCLHLLPFALHLHFVHLKALVQFVQLVGCRLGPERVFDITPFQQTIIGLLPPA